MEPYETPELIEFGTVEELTQSGTSFFADTQQSASISL